MEEIWHDGTRRKYSGLASHELAEKLRATADNAEKIAFLKVYPEDFSVNSKLTSGPYPDNRQGRRRWARELRRKQ